MNKHFIPHIISSTKEIDQCTLSNGFDVDLNLFGIVGKSDQFEVSEKQNIHVNLNEDCAITKLSKNRYLWPLILESSFRRMQAGNRPHCDAGREFSCDIRDLFALWLGLPMEIELFSEVEKRDDLEKILDQCDGAPVFIRLYHESDGYSWVWIVEHAKKYSVWESQSSDTRGQLIINAESIQRFLDEYPKADIIYSKGPAAVKL